MRLILKFISSVLYQVWMASLTKEDERRYSQTENARGRGGALLRAPSDVREEYANEARCRTMSISETSAEHDARAKQPFARREPPHRRAFTEHFWVTRP